MVIIVHVRHDTLLCRGIFARLTVHVRYCLSLELNDPESKESRSSAATLVANPRPISAIISPKPVAEAFPPPLKSSLHVSCSGSNTCYAPESIGGRLTKGTVRDSKAHVYCANGDSTQPFSI